MFGTKHCAQTLLPHASCHALTIVSRTAPLHQTSLDSLVNMTVVGTRSSSSQCHTWVRAFDSGGVGLKLLGRRLETQTQRNIIKRRRLINVLVSIGTNGFDERRGREYSIMRGKMYFFVTIQVCRADTAYRRSGSVLLEKLIGAINAQTGFVACRAR